MVHLKLIKNPYARNKCKCQQQQQQQKQQQQQQPAAAAAATASSSSSSTSRKWKTTINSISRADCLFWAGHMLQCDKREMKTPKHILIGMSVRHLTENTKLINIVNRHGHSASHPSLLEMETAMCDSIQVSSGRLPPSIMPDNNLMINLSWDFC
ncbi:hypothetical protein PoB_003688300 [Plakobranchus ocellatus]|uniref:Uncharacterized protein n=1 Tax=Plakobranchus ocellatus TaxID=259542 RepID=A0AAV4AUZ5_9GAST|nr:hypothetical protein PoB_003688300 [Plakobranchus ocellatus]